MGVAMKPAFAQARQLTVQWHDRIPRMIESAGKPMPTRDEALRNGRKRGIWSVLLIFLALLASGLIFLSSALRPELPDWFRACSTVIACLFFALPLYTAVAVLYRRITTGAWVLTPEQVAERQARLEQRRPKR